MLQNVPGSWFLKAAFPLLATVVVLATAEMVRRGSLRCGDEPAVAMRRANRFVIAAALWWVLAMTLAATGVLQRFNMTPPPFLILPVGIVALAVLFVRSEAGDRVARGVPLAALVGLQAFRLPLELVMHRAFTEGLMPVQMSYSGWNLDIVTGITALLLAVVMSLVAIPRWLVAAWNVLGLVLLANIVTIAILSTPRFQYFGPDRLNVWVTWPPYVLLPAILVLAALAGHLVIFRALGTDNRA